MKNKYNTQLRQAMSDKYIEYQKRKAELVTEYNKVSKQIDEVDKNDIAHNEFMGLQNKATQLGSEISKIDIQIDIWDKAREICLDIADDV